MQEDFLCVTCIVDFEMNTCVLTMSLLANYLLAISKALLFYRGILLVLALSRKALLPFYAHPGRQ